MGFVTELATQTVTFSYNSARGFPFRSVIKPLDCRQSCRWQRFMKIHNATPPPLSPFLSIHHLLRVITLFVVDPMKSKAARGFPSTTCQGHFSLQSTLETRLSRDARKSSRTTHSPDTLFFLPLLSEERERKWRGLFFSCIGSSL